mgnify:CR=1 FL=1
MRVELVTQHRQLRAGRRSLQPQQLVRLAHEGDELSFSVTDDGVGFDRDLVALGSGMTNMADRIEALNGTLVVTSAPGEGTTVSGRLPSRLRANTS